MAVKAGWSAADAPDRKRAGVGASMIAQPPGDVTRILADLCGQDRTVMAELLPLVYEDLRRLADGLFSHERRDHTLQPTALVHEAYLRLMQQSPERWQSREHFFRAAAVVMRHILVNHARDRRRLKRGGAANQVPLDDGLAVFEERAIDLVALDEALSRLAEFDKRQAQIVELRFFAGLSPAEVGEVLGVSPRTVEGDWALARAWLLREIGSAGE
jgi:RNA polymerase sigma-70 factor (ECF subfamily)